MKEVLQQYGLGHATVNPFGNGLINGTWKIEHDNNVYVLQCINHHVFKNPQHIDDNIFVIKDYLSKHAPEYFFPVPIATVDGKTLLHLHDKFYRLFPFVENSHSKDVVATPDQAFKAAAAFGKYTRTLCDMDATLLKTTLPNFHDLELRYAQFEQSLTNGNPQRILEAKDSIDFLKNHKYLVDTYHTVKSNPECKWRVTHHDTKISNLLFNDKDEVLCVIDLDTTMPGYFISDLGDMMRTYLSPASEEEQDFSKVIARPQFYNAIIDGYSSQMNDILTSFEKNLFSYAGQYMIYMQALRFITDYFNNDQYYGAKYPMHNFNRALNQIALLDSLKNIQT